MKLRFGLALLMYNGTVEEVKMTVCNFCSTRETRSCKFDNAYVCNDCYNNKDNYADSEDDIVFINMQ